MPGSGARSRSSYFRLTLTPTTGTSLALMVALIWLGGAVNPASGQHRGGMMVQKPMPMQLQTGGGNGPPGTLMDPKHSNSRHPNTPPGPGLPPGPRREDHRDQTGQMREGEGYPNQLKPIPGGPLRFEPPRRKQYDPRDEQLRPEEQYGQNGYEQQPYGQYGEQTQQQYSPAAQLTGNEPIAVQVDVLREEMLDTEDQLRDMRQQVAAVPGEIANAVVNELEADELDEDYYNGAGRLGPMKTLMQKTVAVGGYLILAAMAVVMADRLGQ